jgi:hypothetical protein
MAADWADIERKEEVRMGTPSKRTATRAEGRPPEEAESDDPEEQAEAILEDSEERLEKGSRKSTGTD